jgi:uncharacterized membrane protein
MYSVNHIGVRRTTALPLVEGRRFWAVVILLCVVATAVSIRRLVALATPSSAGGADLIALDALFAAKPGLTASHVLPGLVMALAIPLQLSARVRGRSPRFHRWLGRMLIAVGVVVGISGYAMVAEPVGGWVETSAIVVYATAFLAALLAGWWNIRHGDVARHREWMLRAMAVLLGVATTRPVMGMFFATRGLTHLSPPQFFGAAMWVGFTATVMAAEWHIRRARRPHLQQAVHT